MSEIPYETGAYYIFDRSYNCFKSLFKIETLESYFVVRAKSNLQFKAINWKRRLSRNILSDAIGELSIYKSTKDYPTHRRKVCFWDEEQNVSLRSSPMLWIYLRYKLQNFIKTGGRLSFSLNGLSNI